MIFFRSSEIYMKCNASVIRYVRFSGPPQALKKKKKKSRPFSPNKPIAQKQ